MAGDRRGDDVVRGSPEKDNATDAPQQVPTQHDDPLTDSLDATTNPASGAEPMWREASPRLRASLKRLGVKEEEAEDLMQQVAVRWLASGRSFNSPRQCSRWMHVVAFNLLATRRKSIAELSDNELDELDAFADAPEVDRFEEAVVDRLFVSRVRAELPEGDRRVLWLLARGGPYTTTERVQIHRARPRLQDKFRDALGGLVVGWARLRLRFSNPPPVVPLLGGALMGIALGSFASSGALPQEKPRPAVVRVPVGEADAERAPMAVPSTPAWTESKQSPIVQPPHRAASAAPPKTVPVLGLSWEQKVSAAGVEGGTVERPERPLLCVGNVPIVAPERRCIEQPIKQP